MTRRTRGALVALTFAGTLAGPAVAAAQEAEPSFSCRASALRAPLLGEPLVANPQYTPCEDDHRAVLSGVGIGSDRPNELTVRASLLTATTEKDPTNPSTGQQFVGGSATSTVASARINAFNLIRIDAIGIGTSAGRKCLNGRPDIGGSAVIAFLRINGRPFYISGYNTNIPLLIGTLRISNVQRTEDEIIVRGLWLDLPGEANDIVLAESRGAATGNPCQVEQPPPTTGT